MSQRRRDFPIALQFHRAGLAGVMTAVLGGMVCPAQAQESSDGRDLRKLEEIVVTAQRRSENLEDVPISISVLRGADLDSFTGNGISEALAFVPGVTLTQGNMDGGQQLGVRGVTASGPVFNGSSPIAYYLDAVPFGLVKSAAVPDTSPYDLERVEILRGPQGTLYGASALNGVVRVLTHDANLDDFELKARTSLSTTENGGDNFRGDLALNAPILPGKLGARVVLGYDDISGWIDTPVKKDSNNSNIENLRIKLNAQPMEQLSLGLSGWRFRANHGAPAVSDDNDNFPGVSDQSVNNNYDVLGFKARYDFPGISLTSTTGHIDYATDTRADYDVFGIGVLYSLYESDVLSQEITLSSTEETDWRWSVGGFYRDAEDRLFQDATFLAAAIDFTDTSESIAFFGELTRTFLEGKLELTGGLRYFEDKVEQVENTSHCGSTCPGEPLFRDDVTFDAVSPRVVLTWLRAEDATFYGSYSEGFRSGFNQNANIIRSAPAFRPVKEDALSNYEVGAKGATFDRRLTYDASVYYIQWDDVQQTLGVEVEGVCCFTGVVNGESASGAGFDIALNLFPTDSLNVGTGFSWNDLTLDGPVFQNGFLLLAKGERLQGSYEYTANAHGAYEFALGRDFEGRFSIVASYTSSRPYRYLNGTEIAPIFSDIGRNVDATFSLNYRGRWTATLFVDNATNDRGAPVPQVPNFFTSRVRPRSMGLQFEYRM